MRRGVGHNPDDGGEDHHAVRQYPQSAPGEGGRAECGRARRRTGHIRCRGLSSAARPITDAGAGARAASREADFRLRPDGECSVGFPEAIIWAQVKNPLTLDAVRLVLTVVVTAIVVGGLAMLLRRSAPATLNGQAGTIRPELWSAWITVLGGLAMLAAGSWASIYGNGSWAAVGVALLGAAVAGFMAPSVDSRCSLERTGH